MSDATDRPQDAGRAHRRTKAGPSPESDEVLERYRAAMRAELDDVLGEVRPAGAQLTLEGSSERIRPPLADRLKLWDLAIKLGRELANGEDWSEPPPPPPTRTSGRAGGAPKLTARERRSLAGS